MPITVDFTTDAARVLAEARACLAAEPVLHNVVPHPLLPLPPLHNCGEGVCG